MWCEAGAVFADALPRTHAEFGGGTTAPELAMTSLHRGILSIPTGRKDLYYAEGSVSQDGKWHHDELELGVA